MGLKGAQKQSEIHKGNCHFIPEHGVQYGGQQGV